MTEFKKLGIKDELAKAIQEEKFEKPTLIQEKAIPLVLAGKDVIAGSATGSGKTLVFGATIIQNLEPRKGLQALILTPTRELAEQVMLALRRFSKYKHFKMISIYGGVSINPQIHDLTTADVVIGTPGRVLDHLRRGTINLSQVKIMVLDEADRMCDMGFREDVEQIMKQTHKDRQTLMFSATINDDTGYLASRFMKNPIKISAEKQVDPRKLTQVYYDIQENMKFSLLVHLLNHEEAKLVMVFCNSRNTVDFVAHNLKKSGIESQAIHGGFSQARRSSVMNQFHAQKVFVLVCTDVAARGLDIQGVSHVYNYDIPKDSKQYIHRIGRTARAGKEGKAVNLLSSKDYENFTRVMRDNSVEIPKMHTPQVERIQVIPPIRERPDFRRSHGPVGHRGPPHHGPRQHRERSNAETSHGWGLRRER